MQKVLVSLGVCIALGIHLNAQSPQKAKPSFNCIKATTKVEKMICSDSSGELQRLDRYMNEVYMQLRKELKISKLPDKEQRLKELLDSQRAFIKNLNKVDFVKDSYEERITYLLKLLGEVLDSNNKELCEYARKYKFDDSKWQEVPPSINPPYSIGLCAFGRNNRDDFFEHFCTQNGGIKKDEVVKAIDENSPYLEFPKSYEKQIDIDNDGVLENVILSQGSYFEVLWIYKNGKLDERASDRIYGDDLHLSGAKTRENICINSEEACRALETYALPSNKISQRLEFGFENPILSYLVYNVMEFQGKNYITLYNRRFNFDENSTYPRTRIYLLEGDKRELKCSY